MRQETSFKTNILKNLSQGFATSLTYQYHSIYILNLGAGPLIQGYINSLSGGVNTFLSIPAGLIADRLGVKKVFLFTLTTYMISALAFGLSPSWEFAAVATVLYTVAFTLDRTACPMICGTTLESSERVTGMGICDTISFFPTLIAPLVAAFLISTFGGMNVNGIRPLYFIQLLGLLIALGIIYTRFENPEGLERSDLDSRIFSNLNKVLSEGVMIKRWLIMRGISTFSWNVMFYVPLFAAEMKGADQYIIGGMSTASAIVMVLLAIPLGHLADTRGRKKVVSVAVFLVCLSYLVLVYAPNKWFILLSGFLSGFSISTEQSQTAIAADLVPKQYLGSWYGLLGFFIGIIGIVAPIFCGFLWESVNPQSVFFLLTFTQLVGLSIFLTVPTPVTK